MDTEEKPTNKPRKPKLSKKRKRREKAYELLNKFFKKASNDLKKISKREGQTTITVALDLTGNDNVIEEIIYKDLEPIKALEGYRIMHNVCKGMDKQLDIYVASKTFRAPGGPNTSYVPKVKFNLTLPYEAASFDRIIINKYIEPEEPTPYKRKKKK